MFVLLLRCDGVTPSPRVRCLLRRCFVVRLSARFTVLTPFIYRFYADFTPTLRRVYMAGAVELLLWQFARFAVRTAN